MCIYELIFKYIYIFLYWEDHDLEVMTDFYFHFIESKSHSVMYNSR